MAINTKKAFVDPNDVELNELVMEDILGNDVTPESSDVANVINLLEIILSKADDKMDERIKDSAFYAYVGERRSGKSMLAIAHAFRFDPDLTTESVCFSLEDLKKFIYANTKKPVVWDEAGVTAYSRDFMTKISKDLNKFFQVFGYRQIIVLSTFQHAGYLDNHLRGQVDALFWMQSAQYRDDTGRPYTRKFCRPFTVFKTPFSPPFFKPYKVYQTPTSPNPFDIGKIPIPDMEHLMRHYGASGWKAFLKDYDKKKEEFFEQLGMDDEEQEEENGLKAQVQKMKEEHKSEKEQWEEELKNLKINKNEYNLVKRQNKAYLKFINNLIDTKSATESDIARAIEVPVQTLHGWRNRNESSGNELTLAGIKA